MASLMDLVAARICLIFAFMEVGTAVLMAHGLAARGTGGGVVIVVPEGKRKEVRWVRKEGRSTGT